MERIDENNMVVIHEAYRDVWLLFSRPRKVLETYDTDMVTGLLREVDREVKENGLHAAGFVSYEASPAFDGALSVRKDGGFPLAWFGLFPEPVEISTPHPPREAGEPVHWEPSIVRTAYSKAILRIKEHLRQGDSYQVNFTFRMRSPFTGDPWDLFTRMQSAQKGKYGAFIRTEDWVICSASPELFFRLDGDELVSKPMKGTAKRGKGYESDLCEAAKLRHCEKNRAENLMIVDMVRNDMGRISLPGSVTVPELFEVEKYPCMWQMTSTVCSKTDAGLPDIFGALFPPASITGAPKARTMQIISELEASPRRIYTGCIGFLSPGNVAQFNVAIRTVLVDRKGKTAEYGVGGGIVWDSVESAEFEECKTKASVLTRPMQEFSLLETILWKPRSGYFLIERHLERLSESASYFDRKVDIESIREKLSYLSLHMVERPHRIRLIVPPSGEAVIETKIMPSHRKPYRMRMAHHPVHSAEPLLYHKTTCREIYEKALAEAAGYDDVLLWNEENEITESCIANVVVEMDGRLLTPPVCCGLLPGTYRSYLLEQGKVEERIVRLDDLVRCSKIFLINSLRGMWEVFPDQGEPYGDMHTAFRDS